MARIRLRAEGIRATPNLPVDRRGLAVCRGGAGPEFPTRGRLVDAAAETTQLVTDALMMAVWRRGQPDALLHHSDRGSQYTSDRFRRLLDELGITCSMSRSGNCWDNSAMESFFKSLKTERTDGRAYRTRDDAKAEVFDYIERFYNNRRRHSTLGYLSPIQFEQQRQLAWDGVHGTGSSPFFERRHPAHAGLTIRSQTFIELLPIDNSAACSLKLGRPPASPKPIWTTSRCWRFRPSTPWARPSS